MSSAITRLFLSATSALSLLLGCTTETRVEYQHDPTARIETDHALNRAELAPFTVDGVVVAPLLRPLAAQGTQVWLTLWATTGKTAAVRAVQFAGTGAQSAQIQQFPAENTVTTEKPEAKGLQSGDILVGVLSKEAVAAMTASGSAQLTIELRVNPSLEYRRLSFDITRHTTKQWVTH